MITIEHIIKDYTYIYYTKNDDFEYVCDYSVYPQAKSYNIGNQSFLIFAQYATKSAMHNYSNILYRNLIKNIGGEKWLESTTSTVSLF